MSTERAPLVLVVEDDPGIALLERRRLERAGFAVEVAGDLDSAMVTLSKGGVAVVVLDYRLGETTGLDLHRRMRAMGHELPVILVSGSMEDSAIVAALRAGVGDVLVKSQDYLDRLPEAVSGVLGRTSRPEPTCPGPAATCVLVLEDDPGTAVLERRQLERAGYDVHVVTTAAEATAAVRKGDIALALLDLRLAESASGLELYEQWRAEGLEVPAILVTGFADQAIAIRALRLGIRDFVPKASDFLDYLPTAVERVMSQVRIERKLAESELRLASIIATTLDAILMCDAESRIVLFNRSAERMFECRAADVVGRPIGELIPGLALAANADGELRERRELEGVRCSGGSALPLEVTATDVVIHDRRFFTVIARDITERREADKRKDEFLGMLAHELRNPLAAIVNAGEVLHRTRTDALGEKVIAMIRRQSRVLARMIDDLLDVSRVTLGKIQVTLEPLVLGDVVARAVESIRDPAGAAGLTLEVRVDPEPVWVRADSTRLEQVVVNLLTNAVKFTAAGGRITVSAGAEGAEAVVRVRDTGAGIDAALLPRIFDLFVQGDTSLDRARSGLGIGLALVRRIVGMHGGTVQATSAGAGLGSEFTVRLPAMTRERERADTPARHASAAGTLRVLVVDDQADAADAVALLIGMLGHEVHTAYAGAAALALAREVQPQVMIVDIGMPVMTGYEVAQRVRSDPSLAGIQLVALTGYGREEDRRSALAAGFDRHVTKPVTDTELTATLAAAAAALSTPR